MRIPNKKFNQNVHSMSLRINTIYIGCFKALRPIVLLLFSISLFANESRELTLTCPDDLEINLSAGQCGLNVSFDTLTWQSTEELSDTIYFPPSGSFLNIGTTTVTLAATTINGELQTCTFNVTLNEFFPPFINCLTNVELSLDGLCEREVNAAELLDGSSVGCVDNFQVIKIDGGGNILSPEISAEEIGQTFTFVVQHISNGLQCSTEATIVGGTPPSITCPPDITIVCNTPLIPELVGAPDTIGCYNDLSIDYFDITASTLCPDSIGFQKTRYWVSTDPFGKKDTCVQIITAMRYNVGMVEFPPNFDGTDNPPLACSNDGTWQNVASTDVTGVPLFMGNPANTNEECDITSNYQDIAVQVCGATYDIARVWTVINICDPAATVKDTQYIKVTDTISPLFSVPDTIFASSSTECFDSVFISGAFDIEECSTYEVTIFTQWDTIYANGGWSIIDSGTVTGNYPIFYTINDACNNSAFAFSQVLIQESTLAKCPAGTSINCDYYFDVIAPAIALGDLDTLATLGVPEFPGNCSFGYTETDSVSVDGCGKGVVVRTLTSNAAIPEICIQVVTVNHTSNFEAIFPSDTSICIPPNMANLDNPQILDFNCENVEVSHDDEIIVDGPLGCYTIKRKWILTDDCSYTGINNSDDNQTGDNRFMDGGDGIIEYVQTIIVNSTGDPVFPDGCEIPDLYLLSNSCDLTITVPAPEINGCRNIDYKVFGNLGLVMGVDVTIGLGTYNVSYTAEDDCGNIGVCQTQFSVIDTIPPEANCEGAVIVELMVSNEPGEDPNVTVNAIDFDNNSTDNCSQQLNFSFDPNGQVLSQLFTCENIGTNNVTIYITDFFGNQNSCESIVFVQDNVECDLLIPTISGIVSTEVGEGIQSVEVAIETSSTGTTTILTGSDGLFSTQVESGDNVEITPTKNINHSNGVTTFDAVIMTRHILGVELLPTPYKLIAADINNSGTVTTFDIVEMRKLILFIYDNFPNNSSWRFVPSDYNFLDPQNPWQEPFPESIMINNIEEDFLDLDFVGIKIGDLNNSANPMN